MTSYLPYRRFLVARSNDPQAAYKQYSASAAWRRKVALVQTYDNTEIQIFERMNRVVCAYLARFALVRLRTHKCYLATPMDRPPSTLGHSPNGLRFI